MAHSQVYSSNLERLQNAIRLATGLASLDFPHEHSRETLLHIRGIFESGYNDVNSQSEETDHRVLNALCSAELRKLFDLFPLLGFIVRSTDVRNAFEIQRSFLRIVRAFLGEEAKLILSSEWNFSPFTFLPPTQYGLANTVMIGIPASESENALVLPLAGHELAHNIWAAQNLRRHFGPNIESAIVNYILNDQWDEFSECFNDVTKENVTDFVGAQSWELAWRWAMDQCEELFCDFIGIAVFREAYLHAYSYLIAPGLPQQRVEGYPGSAQRASHHAMAAEKYGICVPEDYVDRFNDEDRPSDRIHRLLLDIADQAVSVAALELATKADELVRSAGFGRCEQSELDNIEYHFSKGVPAQNISGLPVTVNAAWQFYLSDMSAWRHDYPSVFTSNNRPLEMLSDLVFKTIEVHEIQLIMDA